MLDRILLNPDNRLLGSSTGDLSLYGGQSDPMMVLREARSEDGSVPRQAPVGGSEGTPSSGPAGAQPGVGPAFAVEAEDMTGAPAMLAAAPFSFLQPLAPVHADAAQPSVTTPMPASPTAFIPAAYGSGAPLAPAGAVPDTPSENIAAALGSGPATDGLGDLLSGNAQHGLDSLAGDTLDAVGTTLEGAGGLASDTLDSVGSAVSTTLAGVVGVADDTLGGVGAALDGVGAAAGDSVAGAAAIVGDAVDGVAAPVLDGTANLTETTLDAAADTLSGVTQAVAPLTGGLAPLADSASEGVSATIGAVGSTAAGLVESGADVLEGVSGSDPEGGVATLVSLVSVSDMFDLHPVDAPAAADASGDPGFAMLDALASDLPDTLLGADHHDDGGAGEGGHDHLFGL